MTSSVVKRSDNIKRLFSNNEIAFQIILLTLISGIIYLPRIGQFQYYKDDWYYVLDGLYGGPAIFNEMFAIDRPARGPFFQAYFSLFGANPLPYHLGHYFWRVLAAVAALWLFRMLWPQRPCQSFIGALFFLIYPGYLWWISGIEYQPIVVSVCLQVLSIALTVKAILTRNWLEKAILVPGSILTGWGYLALVDYAIGMEFFRLAAIFVLVNREENALFLRRTFKTIKVWFLYSFLIPAGFLFWKLFLFTSERKATDLGTQLATFSEAPRQALKLWLIGIVRDSLTVSVLAWIEPFSQSFWNLKPNEIIIGLIFVLVLILFMYAMAFMLRNEPAEVNRNFEPLFVGLLSCIAGVFPITFTNRYIDFGFYSHYSLPVSLAGALFLASLVGFITPRQMQLAFVSFIVGTAVLTHYTVSISVVKEIDIINSFWWQAYWRTPGISAGTTLIVDYPSSGFNDQTDNIWGPANLLYYPDDKQQDIPVYYRLAALPLSGPELGNVLSNGDLKSGYRTHYFRYDVNQIVILSQPLEGACVRILDGTIPILSSNEAPEIRTVVHYSNLNQLLLNSPSSAPSPVFGKEPEHGWCYYYEKLELALQKGDQETALSLANEALSKGFSPRDPVEWIPFLWTYMVENDAETVTSIARSIKKDEILEKQVCDVFLAYHRGDPQLTQQMIDTVNFLFCHK